MLQHCFVLATMAVSAVLAAPQGYHYDPPRRDRIVTHQFSSLPTVSPLPPIPALPPLPTAPSRVSQQTLVQTHPSPARGSYHSSAPIQPIVPLSQLPQPQPFRQQQQPQQKTQQVFNSYPAKQIISSYLPPQQQQQQAPAPQVLSIQKSQTLYSGPADGFNTYIPPALQTFGPTAAADGDVYSYMGRNFKQYQVVEIIDNDIEKPPPPTFVPRMLNSARAFVGASGTGALPALGASLNSLQQAQQQLAFGSGPSGGGGTVALGSGGLGFVRLPNGSVSLGSGSLGYVSNEQRSQSIQDARNRKESASPDAVHFGHGALGGNSFFFN